MNRRLWTPAELALVRELYPHVKTEKIAERLGNGRTTAKVYAIAKKLGLKKSAEFLASPDASRLRRGDNIGAPYRFPPGHVPANKGLRRPGYAPGRMAETQFKKGQKPWTYRYEVGDLRLNADGYVDMKISDTAKGAMAWRALHTILWEDKHGPVPPGHAVAFVDGDKLNVWYDNLTLITRAELCRRNSVHNLPPALKETVYALGRLHRRIRREEQNRGLTKSSFRHTRRPARQRSSDGARSGARDR